MGKCLQENQHKQLKNLQNWRIPHQPLQWQDIFIDDSWQSMMNDGEWWWMMRCWLLTPTNDCNSSSFLGDNLPAGHLQVTSSSMDPTEHGNIYIKRKQKSNSGYQMETFTTEPRFLGRSLLHMRGNDMGPNLLETWSSWWFSTFCCNLLYIYIYLFIYW